MIMSSFDDARVVEINEELQSLYADREEQFATFLELRNSMADINERMRALETELYDLTSDVEIQD